MLAAYEEHKLAAVEAQITNEELQWRVSQRAERQRRMMMTPAERLKEDREAAERANKKQQEEAALRVPLVKAPAKPDTRTADEKEQAEIFGRGVCQDEVWGVVVVEIYRDNGDHAAPR